MGRFHTPSVVDRLRLEQHNPGFFIGDRLVFHAAGNDDHLACGERLHPVAIMHVKRPLEHEKELVLIVVAVPHELALDFGDFDVLAVEGSHDVGVPMVGDQVKFGFSSGVHISMVAVAPCFIMCSQLFLASDVSTSRAAVPWSDGLPV